MKTRSFLLIAMFFSAAILLISCDKEDETSERFRFLTEAEWRSDSLLINGFDASGPGQLLVNFRGTARFNADGTGTFGNYQGKWRFTQNETQLIIESDSLPLPLSTLINELTAASLKVSTSFPNLENPTVPLQIRLTFKAQ